MAMRKSNSLLLEPPDPAPPDPGGTPSVPPIKVTMDNDHSSTSTSLNKKSPSSGIITLDPYVPPRIGSVDKRRPKFERGKGKIEIIPGLFEPAAFDKFLIFSIDECTFDEVNIFKVHKEIVSCLGRDPKITPQNSKTLLIEVKNQEESQKLQKLKNVNGLKTSCLPHPFLNKSRGVIYAKELVRFSDEDLLEALRDQSVVDIRRVRKKVNDIPTTTPLIILTFNRLTIPNEISAAWYHYNVRPYVPSPKRCFYCQKFGHVITTCRRKLKGDADICENCAEVQHGVCNRTSFCTNCDGSHPASSRTCPRYIFEKEVLTTKVKEKISFKEAKTKVSQRIGSDMISYSNVVRKQITKNLPSKSKEDSSKFAPPTTEVMEISVSNKRSLSEDETDLPPTNKIKALAPKPTLSAQASLNTLDHPHSSSEESYDSLPSLGPVGSPSKDDPIKDSSPTVSGSVGDPTATSEEPVGGSSPTSEEQVACSPPTPEEQVACSSPTSEEQVACFSPTSEESADCPSTSKGKIHDSPLVKPKKGSLNQAKDPSTSVSSSPDEGPKMVVAVAEVHPKPQRQPNKRKKEKNVIVCLQETKLDETTPCPRDYFSFRTPFNPDVGTHGGCLMYVRRDIPHIPLNLTSTLEGVAVQVDIGRRYTICCLYLPPNASVSKNDLVQLISQLPKPFIILGDMNARHHLWGDDLCKPRGNMFASLIEEEDIALLNTGDPTHYHVQTGSFTAIDLSLCSSDCSLDFNWQVYDYGFDDHFPLVINTANGPPIQATPRWNIDKADWSKFCELSTINANADEIVDVDTGIQLISNKFLAAGIRSIPRTTGIYKRRPVPWWSDHIKGLHRSTRKALNKCRRHRSDDNLIFYRRCRARLRRAIKEAKQQSWTKFVSSFNSKTSPTVMWKNMRKINGKFNPTPPPVLRINGNLITNPQDVANAFADHFEEISKKSKSAPGYLHRMRQELVKLNFKTTKEESYNLPFSEREFDSALSSCSESAPGEDDIPYAMLRHISVQTKQFIISLFNRIWREYLFPNAWETGITLPFAKPKKDNTLRPNYRPITLTSCLCKVMEKMVNIRLSWFLESKGIVFPIQCGGRKMNSTTDVLLRIESSICKAFATKQHHVSVFFDLEKAYDTTWRYGILKAVYECGIRGELAFFIQSFLSQRNFRVRVGNVFSESRCQQEGVPQGCVLSLTLFTLALNGLASVIPPDILATLYVDDFSISFKAARMAVAERRIQLCINKVVEWADNHGFKFSTSKTVAVHFCRIRGLHLDPDLYLKGQRIPCVEETRFLGLILDHKLTWLPHLKSLKTKSLEAQQVLKVLSHTNWGADRTSMLRIHHALILSKVSYGCEIYSSATVNRLKILDSIHHSSIRLATGAFKSSPIPSLLVDAGELPLDLSRQSSILRYWHRLQKLPDSLAYKTANSDFNTKLYDSHPKLPQPFGYRVRQILIDFNLPRIPVLPFRFTVTPPWKLPCVRFCRYFNSKKKNFTDLELHSLFLEHSSSHQPSTFIFTDGSKSSAGVGFGVHSENFNCKGALPSITSNFTAEITGILKALEIVSTLDQDEHFTIFTDSKSALQSLELFNPTQPIVLKVMEWLYLIERRGKVVKFCWVPAHVGVAGNESADKLAKDAAMFSIPRNQAIPYDDFISAIKSEIRSIWQFRWELVGTNKMRELTSVTNSWTYPVQQRYQEKILCRLRIGHTRLTHGFYMSGDTQPFCNDCLVPLTVRHFLVECPSLDGLRHKYLSHSIDENGHYAMAKILGNSCNIQTLFKFLEDAGILKDL